MCLSIASPFALPAPASFSVVYQGLLLFTLLAQHGTLSAFYPGGLLCVGVLFAAVPAQEQRDCAALA